MSASPKPKVTAAYKVKYDDHNATLAAVLRRNMPELSWNKVRALCRRGVVRVDGEIFLDSSVRLERFQRVDILAHPPERGGVDAAVEILHLDSELVVVDKPARMLTVPYEGKERDTLQHLTAIAIRKIEGRSAPPLRVVQRLDKDTTGVLVFARTKRAERALQQQFRQHSVDRRYLALALGMVPSQTCQTHLLRDRGDGLRGSWRGSGQAPEGTKRAITHLERLQVFEVDPALCDSRSRPLQITLVSCGLETGRQHQIRIHLSEAGHPIVGDRVYCRGYAGPTLAAFAREVDTARPLLHAERLGFVHPADDQQRTFVRDPPADFLGVLKSLERK